ncbi:hypothetical protein ACFU5E_09500 [Aeromonas bestiarum]|uniref:hypothetical protein n=1 Tax=Aeromonas bestiarum TaxID=105751 RepID=UPI00366B72D9
MTRDYCTGLGPVSPGTNSCCKKHDNDYGAKGRVSRAEADRRLRHCMIAQGKPLRLAVLGRLPRWRLVFLEGQDP